MREVEHLLIGGGLACATCAQSLREGGPTGEIVLVGREPDPPYNRPECSKGYLRGEESREEPLVQPKEFWSEQKVELLTRTSVTALDLDTRVAKLSDKQEIHFEKALIATGANVRRLNVAGCELEQIHYLRTLGNSDHIRAGVADAERVVLIGGSYIGCEVAASLTMMGKQATIVMLEDVTLERGFGKTVGRFFQGLLESHGVTIHGADGLERFEGDGRVGKVVTTNGLELAADAVVIGAGVTPDIALAKRAGLEIGERGGVLCSSRLETSVPGVFAAGDIAEYDSPLHGTHVRIEHWDVAFNHGKTAAANMLGGDVPHEVVPVLLFGARRLGRTRIRRSRVRVGRGDRARLLRAGQLHHVVSEGRSRGCGAHLRPSRRSRHRPPADRRASGARRGSAPKAREPRCRPRHPVGWPR